MENRLGFANYTGNLVTSRLGDLCERIMRKNSENQSDLPLTISSIDGLVDQRDYFNKVVAAKDMSGYYLLKRGEFAYNKSYSVGYDYGTIKRLNKYDEGCLSTLYICFAIKSNAIDSNYLECFFDSLVWYKDMANVCTEGARNHGLLNVDIEEFFNIKVVYPADIEEQKKTAKILNNLDEKIKAEKTNVEKLKALKSSMLTKMFPKEGESVPELRFKGFTDPWEQRKLGDIGSVSMCRRIFKEQTSLSGDVPFYKIGTFGAEPDAFISKKLFEEYKLKYPYPNKGDILISASGSIGKTVEYTGKNEYFQDSNIVWLKHEDYIKNSFLKCYYSIVKWSGIEGSTIKRLYNENILNTSISVPSETEQEQLGVFFENIELLITLHQRKYEKLLDVKKAFLEKMIGGDN